MNILVNSYVKGFLVTFVVLSVSIASAFVLNRYSVFIPEHQFNFELTDTLGDVNEDQIDIIEFGSYRSHEKVVLYLEVVGTINTSLSYRIFIVAKTPGEDIAHIYFNDVSNGSETNYESDVFIDGNRLEIHFSLNRFISNSYMVGIEASAHSIGEEDNTPSARENSLKTRFLGII